MKKRISIYIDEGIWGIAQGEARRLSVEVKSNISASEVVEDSIKAFIKLRTQSQPIQQVKEPQQSQEVTQPQHKTQDEFDELRKGRDVRPDKIAKVKGRIREEVPVASLTGFTGGYSKEHQARKKGGK